MPLTVVKKKDKAWKGQKIEEVRSALDKYKNVFVFSVKNLRTDKMQKVREDWKGSRFFMGKNSVIQVAFGKTESSEYKDGLAKVSDQLKGHRGILFTDHSRTEVMKYVLINCLIVSSFLMFVSTGIFATFRLLDLQKLVTLPERLSNWMQVLSRCLTFQWRKDFGNSVWMSH